KLLSVITPIGIDHERYLGDSLAAIAGEKAGIIATGVPVVSSPQEPEAMAVIAREAETRRAPLAVAHARGTDPVINAKTARLAIDELARLGIAVTTENFATALLHFDWPGRYQWIGEVLLDGAHNGHGVQALIAALDADVRTRGRPMHLVATVLVDK